MRPVIIIPARLAASRLPGKMLADIHGMPMIVHVMKRAEASGIGPVYVACDDAGIAAAVSQAGGRAILTRPDHPSGSDRIYEALLTFAPQGRYDVIVNLQGDVPAIAPEDIRAVLAPLANPDVDIATLACAITHEPERTDPSVVKPVLAFHNEQLARALYFSRAPLPYGEGPQYHHVGIYAYRRRALERFVQLPPSPLEKREKLEQLRALEANMRIDAAIVTSVPLGVDTPEHLERARKILAPTA